MSAKEKLNERLLRQWASEETLKQLRALEAERDKAWQSLKKANAGFEKYERQFYLVSAQLEQALLDRDTLKAETLRLAKERDEAVYEARYMFEQIAQSEAIYPERWQASDERAMLISERDSYARDARKARREALEWALDHCLTFGLSVAGIERLRAELARLEAEEDE